MKKSLIPLIIGLNVFALNALSQEANYDESKIPAYTLPDPLLSETGMPIRDSALWKYKRRPEILELFRKEVYGRLPEETVSASYTVQSLDENALGGKAIRKEVTITLSRNGVSVPLELLIFLPKNAAKPVPAFVGLNFSGNHTVSNDPAVPVTGSWVRNNTKSGIADHKAREENRGMSVSRWQIERVIGRGYALATMYYGDIDPDYDDGFKNGIHQLFADKNITAESWGSIASWAWGLSRIMDYFETDTDIDHGKVALMGHSRLGKTSLWGGAEDQRFAIVISNDSGCGGAALSRRAIGETVWKINSSFPHWFCDNFLRYNNNENEIPVDQHMLISLMAPRPVYVASAEEDSWADPKGEFLSAYYASPVYHLFALKGIDTEKMPAVKNPIMNHIGYHIRPGKHNVTEYDWDCYLDFADMHYGK